MCFPGTTVRPRYRDVMSSFTVLEDVDAAEGVDMGVDVMALVMVDEEGYRYSWVWERIMLRSESVHLNSPTKRRASVVVMRRVLFRRLVR